MKPEKSADLAPQLASELLNRAKTGPFYVQAMVAAEGTGAAAGDLAQAMINEGSRTGDERFALEGDCWHLLGALRRHTPSMHHVFGKMSAESMGQVPERPASIVVDDEGALEDPSAPEEATTRLGRTVLSAIGDPASKDGLDITRRYRSIISHNIPYAGALPKPGAISAAIRAEWPWAADLARFLEGRVELMRRAHSAFVRLPPVLLLGDTGSGKTTIATALADLLDVPMTMVACGGVSDSGGLAATARGWTTSRPCAPFQAIATSHRANPLVVLDELDKGTPARSQNGSVWASALGILEQADRYFDPCLQANVDLSAITYIATANNLDVMPPELVDRFLVLKVPRPRPEDFEIVLRGALKAEAKSMQTHVELLPELDRHDKAFLRDMFGKRRHSLRSFRKMVSLLIGEKAMVAGPQLLH
ncbi:MULTISPECIES: AAA family ATPase [unclassified Bradyrhizobium]